MGAYPTSPRSEFLTWCAAHTQIFVDNAAEIGITPLQATAFGTAVALATSKTNAQQQKKQELHVATLEVREAFDELHALTGDLVRVIKAFAETSDKPSVVYNAAQIDPPAPPTPAAPPAQPTNLTIELAPGTGALTLRWKASNPPNTQGTSYIVRRRVEGEAGFTFIGVTGTKSFTDTTLVAGPDKVEYTVQGTRSDSTGPISEPILVNFGTAPGGGMTATGTMAGDGDGEAKLAA